MSMIYFSIGQLGKNSCRIFLERPKVSIREGRVSQNSFGGMWHWCEYLLGKEIPVGIPWGWIRVSGERQVGQNCHMSGQNLPRVSVGAGGLVIRVCKSKQD